MNISCLCALNVLYSIFKPINCFSLATALLPRRQSLVGELITTRKRYFLQILIKALAGNRPCIWATWVYFIWVYKSRSRDSVIQLLHVHRSWKKCVGANRSDKTEMLFPPWNALPWSWTKLAHFLPVCERKFSVNGSFHDCIIYVSIYQHIWKLGNKPSWFSISQDSNWWIEESCNVF